ncbi:hypothetical protein Acr_00g0002610 [Actinidia rufa]|uniref:Uncharacterized protein n=1 Tax=Actinidia rufa TaxID=165716 RepID=A0A7J0D702_9ERIC|nr:hypothetical protein Acr_00g0002610 [Actinidia rufa]
MGGNSLVKVSLGLVSAEYVVRLSYVSLAPSGVESTDFASASGTGVSGRSTTASGYRSGTGTTDSRAACYFLLVNRVKSKSSCWTGWNCSWVWDWIGYYWKESTGPTFTSFTERKGSVSVQGYQSNPVREGHATKDQSCSRLCALSFPEDEKCAYLFNAHFAPKCIGAPKMDSSQRFTASSFRQGLEKPSRHFDAGKEGGLEDSRYLGRFSARAPSATKRKTQSGNSGSYYFDGSGGTAFVMRCSLNGYTKEVVVGYEYFKDGQLWFHSVMRLFGSFVYPYGLGPVSAGFFQISSMSTASNMIVFMGIFRSPGCLTARIIYLFLFPNSDINRTLYAFPQLSLHLALPLEIRATSR